jgi:membrane protease subunit HflC
MTRLLVIAGVLIGLWAGLVAAGNVGLGPLVITREGEQKLILLLGDVRKVTEPGWALRLPLLEDVEKYDRRLLFLDSEPLPIQTRDEERIVIDNYAVWRIDDPVAFRRSFPAGMAQAQSRIDRAVRNDVREVIGRQTLADVLKDERVAIMREITEQTQATLSQYGIAVVDVRINRTELPEGTEKNVYARMTTERQRLARKHRAEGDEKARRIRAEAEREARVIVAEAHRDAEIVRGEGDAAATQIYGEAYGEAPEFYAFVRTLEAYRKTLGSDTTLVTSPRSDFFRFLDAADGAAGQR